MHISTLSKNIFIAGLLLSLNTSSNLYAAAIEESDDVESTYVADDVQEQPEVTNVTEDQWVDESATSESTTEQLQEQPEYPEADVAQPTESPASSDTTDANDAETDAQPEAVNVEEILAQAVAQPQPRALFNRYALCSTSTIRTIQQFVAEQVGSFAAALICEPLAAKNGRLCMNEAGRTAVLWTYYLLRYAQRMVNFASLVDAIEASMETETTTPHAEIHTKAFNEGLPLAAASAIAAFLSTAVTHLFNI